MDTKKLFWMGWEQPLEAKWPALRRLPRDILGIWKTGERGGDALMAGLVFAPHENNAKALIKEHFDVTDWRFCNVKPFGESLGDRFDLTKEMRARFKAAEYESKSTAERWEEGFRRIAELVSPCAAWTVEGVVEEVRKLKAENEQLRTVDLDKALGEYEGEPVEEALEKTYYYVMEHSSQLHRLQTSSDEEAVQEAKERATYRHDDDLVVVYRESADANKYLSIVYAADD